METEKPEQQHNIMTGWFLKIRMQVVDMVKEVEAEHKRHRIGCPIARVSVDCFAKDMEERLVRYFDRLMKMTEWSEAPEETEPTNKEGTG